MALKNLLVPISSKSTLKHLFVPRERPIPEPEPKSTELLLGYEDKTPIYLPAPNRIQHLWIPGLSQNGKTTLIKNLILQDIEQGHGLAYIDPHGDAAEDLIGLIPEEHASKVLYFDPTQPNCPAFNPFRLPYETHKVVTDFLSILHLMFADGWGFRLEHILRYGIADRR